MTSAPRRPSATGLYHVMNRGGARRPIFFADEDRREFGRRLAAIHRDDGVTTLVYALMTNHFHLLLRSPSLDVLSEAMQHLQSVYTRHTNDRLGIDGKLFRGEYLSVPVESDRHLMWLPRYIHRNPLDIAGVTSPGGYRWSSYRTYVGNRCSPAFLDMAPVLALFGGRRHAPAAFTEDLHADAGPMTAADVLTLVACGVAIDDLTSDDQTSRQWTCRVLVTLLIDRLPVGRLRQELEASLGERSPRAASMARRRARQRLAEDPAVGRALLWVEAELARSSSEVLRAG